MNRDTIAKWFQDGGNNTHYVDYPLNVSSLVVDVGGYKGDWVAAIVQRYNPYVWVFEPIEEFYVVCKERFKDNPKVSVYNYGLSDKDEEQGIALRDDASAVCAEGTRRIVLKDAASILSGIHVDLISINIEGSEYTVLPKMLESGVAILCKYIQVQFHWKGIEGCVAMRDAIRSKLAETHNESYCYQFVWESWTRR